MKENFDVNNCDTDQLNEQLSSVRSDLRLIRGKLKTVEYYDELADLLKEEEKLQEEKEKIKEELSERDGAKWGRLKSLFRPRKKELGTMEAKISHLALERQRQIHGRFARGFLRVAEIFFIEDFVNDILS